MKCKVIYINEYKKSFKYKFKKVKNVVKKFLYWG